MKTRTYHEDCIRYNRELAEVAERLATELRDKEISEWCAGIGRQHRFHERRHEQALERLDKPRPTKKEKGAKKERWQEGVEALEEFERERDAHQHELADQITEGLEASKDGMVEWDIDANRPMSESIAQEQAEFAAEKESVA